MNITVLSQGLLSRIVAQGHYFEDDRGEERRLFLIECTSIVLELASHCLIH